MNEEKQQKIIDATPQERPALLREYNREIFHREENNRLYQPDKRVVEPQRKIALVGASGSGNHAPLEDPSWEVWTVGRNKGCLPYCTRWYELHRNEGNGEKWLAEMREVAETAPGDLWTMYPLPGVSKPILQFPTDEMIQRFGSYFMTSSFSWMMAHAISELWPLDGEHTPGEIGIWGADMEYGSEYENQRDGFRHFIELARFAGIYVTRLASGGLSHEPVPYPMRIDDPLLNKLDFRQVATVKNCLKYALDIKDATELIGEHAAVIGVVKNLPESPEKDKAIENAEVELSILNEQMGVFKRNLTHWEAIESEQQWLRNYLT